MDFFNNSGENAFKILFNSVSEGILVVNDSQEIVAANAAANTMFGYPDKSLSGKKLAMLIPQQYHQAHTGHFNSFMRKTEKRNMGHGRDLYGQKKDGSVFPIEAGLNPFTVQERQYVMALVINITDRKAQEEQILQLNSQLEERITQRTKALNSTVKELKAEVIKRAQAEEQAKESLKKEQELGELKTKFLSLVSHEFKTPLSGILSSVNLIGKYTTEQQQEKRDKHVSIIQNKVKYLNNILNDFLSIERLETGKVSYNFTSFSLSKVLNEVLYDMNMLLKDGQHIKYPHHIDEAMLLFDEKILELVLSNLIRNAVKYSPEDTTIVLDGKISDNTLEISIKDQGMGIPKAAQKHVFNRYFRAENALLTQGTGIGLNIVRSHLENLGGTITFISEEGEGSTFTIRIPMQPENV